jgi:hypothetical protein
MMVAPAAGLSRSLRSLPLAALGDIPAVRRDAPPKSMREGGCGRRPSDGAPLRGRVGGSPRRRAGPAAEGTIERTLDYVDDVQDAVNILVRAGVDKPRSLTSLTR